MQREKSSHIAVVGLGAIGSQLLPLLARMPGLAHLTLIDPQSFAEGNLHGQNIFRCDIGDLKVAAMARRALAINPDLEVTALPAAVEDLPLAAMRADLLVACVDSRLARLIVNEIAFRLGIPWIDTGVLGVAHLARVTAYFPGENGPCAECSMDARDYALLETEYPCGAQVASEAPSDTTAVLASLASSLAANECQKLLAGDRQHAAVGCQVTVDARSHRMISTTFRRNPDCRFDHAQWEIAPLRCSLQRLTIARALASTGPMRVAGHRFVLQSVCTKCGLRFDGLRLDRPKSRCPKCGARMIAPAFAAMIDRLDTSLPPEYLDRTLAQIGLRAGDVVCGADQYYELLPEVS